MKNYIALPWRERGASNYRIRHHDRSRWCGCVWYSVHFGAWYFDAYDCNSVGIFTKPLLDRGVTSKDAAMKTVDAALVAAGWRLINGEDKLAILI